MDSSSKIRGKVVVDRVLYYKNEWGILSTTPIKMEQGEPILNYSGHIIIKGVMPTPEVGESYYITANYDPSDQYGDQYSLVNIVSTAFSDCTTEEDKRYLLEKLYTPGIVKEMYAALSDPFTALKNNDVKKLLTIKGCGLIKVRIWTDRFHERYGAAMLAVALKEYEISDAVLRKIIQQYASPEIAIQKIKDNPYCLTEIPGIGFATADKIAMSSGIDEYDPRRIGGFILDFLLQSGENGYSYVPNTTVMDKIVDYFGDEIPNLAIAEAIHSDFVESNLWWSDDKEWIGMRRYFNLESSICENVIRLINAEPKVRIEHWQDKLVQIEEKQGWSFTEQQLIGIKTAMENNVTIINGLGGTGKTSLALGIIEILKGYDIALTALSGKAALRLAEVSGTPGMTIHRLLGYNPDQGFIYNSENKLSHEVIIIDEISMIGGGLFNNLLSAVRDGAKIIMIGDTGQLEAIGACNVAYDLITCGIVPVVTLDKIHRQAQKSAIITESIKIRKGQQIIKKDWAGIEIRGENQDLILECFSDKSNTYHKTYDYFKQEFERANYDLYKIQVLAPLRSRGDASVRNLNIALQKYCNPPSKTKTEIDVAYSGYVGTLREGDKIINTKNNYKARTADGNICPIFNGNIGVIKKIDLFDEIMIIDFSQIGEIVIPKSTYNTIELGYAITVHKFQGSQAETIIFAIDFSSYTLLTREMLYTGITRAQKKCILIAQNTALRFATDRENTSHKLTHLQRLMVEAREPKRLKF